MKKMVKILICSLLLCSLAILPVHPAVPQTQVSAAETSGKMTGKLENGFSWSLDKASKTMTIDGKGTLSVNFDWSQYKDSVDTVKLGDGITDLKANIFIMDFETLELGASFREYPVTWGTPNAAFAVSSKNPYFSVYDGVLYSKDGKTLICVPAKRRELTIKPGTEVIADYSFWRSKADYVILPEGVKTVEPTAFHLMEGEGMIPVVVPDSIQSIEMSYSVSSCYNVYFIYSEKNEVAKKAFPQNSGENYYNLAQAWEKVGYLTAEQIYNDEKTPAYGYKELSGNPYFLTKDGFVWNEWVCQDGRISYLVGEHGSNFLTRAGVFSYRSANGEWASAYFNLDSNGVLTSKPPEDMMVVTPESSKPVLLSSLPFAVPSEKFGFVTESDKTYYYQDGKKLTGLQYIGDKAYIFTSEGVMQKSGWYTAGGYTFYLNDYGAGVVSCWRLGEDGKYRYLKADGKMARSEWVQDYGKWYYVGSDGKKYTGRMTIYGKAYTFDQNGVLLDPAYPEGPSQSAAPASPSVSNGFVEQGGKKYYYQNGGMVKGWFQDSGNWYYAKADGSCCVSEWCWTGYKNTGSTWYWFDASGKMVANRWVKLNGIWYFLRPSGGMASNYWVKTGGKWYYCNKSGDMAVNQWINTGSYWYYVGSDGAMLKSTTTPDGYRVDAQGRWKK